MFKRHTALLRTLTVIAALVMGLTVLTSAADPAPVTLEFWHSWTGDREPLMNEVLRRFEAKYPWVTVQPRLMPTGVLEEQTVLAVTANTAPDLVMMSFSHSTGLGLRGAFLPLSPLARRDGVDLADYFYPPVVDMLLNNPMANPGEFYYLPQTIDPSWFLYYNIPMLESAGLNTVNAPTTWSELEDYSRRLLQRDSTGTITQIGVDVASHRTPMTFLQLLGASGGQRYSDDLRRVIVNEPESNVLMTLNWINDFTRQVNGGIEAVDALHSTSWNRFLEEKSGMVIVGAYNTFVATERGINLGMALMPSPDGYTPHTPLTLGWGYGIPSNADHPDEAWLLLQHLTMDVNGGGWFMMQQGRPGAAMEMNVQPEYADTNPYWHVIQQSFNRSTPGQAGPPIGGFDEIIGGMVRDVVYGNVGPNAAVDRAQQLLEARIDTYWTDMDKLLQNQAR